MPFPLRCSIIETECSYIVLRLSKPQGRYGSLPSITHLSQHPTSSNSCGSQKATQKPYRSHDCVYCEVNWQPSPSFLDPERNNSQTPSPGACPLYVSGGQRSEVKRVFIIRGLHFHVGVLRECLLLHEILSVVIGVPQLFKIYWCPTVCRPKPEAKGLEAMEGWNPSPRLCQWEEKKGEGILHTHWRWGRCSWFKGQKEEKESGFLEAPVMALARLSLYSSP